MKKTYNKLVRDKIIDKIIANGEKPKYSTLTKEQYINELHKKLLEEVNEFVEADDPEELADVLEVLLAIAKIKNIKLEDAEAIRRQKRLKRGGFDKKIYLEEVETFEK